MGCLRGCGENVGGNVEGHMNHRGEPVGVAGDP
jgi:hypothetical protein